MCVCVCVCVCVCESQCVCERERERASVFAWGVGVGGGDRVEGACVRECVLFSVHPDESLRSCFIDAAVIGGL